MSNSFTEEQGAIVRKDISDFLLDKGKFLHLLRERGEVIDMEDKVNPDISFNQELKHGQIGIKSHNVGFIDSKLKKIAVIKMILKIDRRLVNVWIENGMERNIIYAFKIFSDIVRFCNQIEQFILRGRDTKIPFLVNELKGDEHFESFFCSLNEIEENKVTIAGDFYKAVINLEHRLRSENFFPPFALLSDSKTKIMAEIGPHYYEVPRKTEKRIIEEKNEIVEWMDLVNANNSEENDHKLVCIANPDKYRPNFRVIEKSPLELFIAYDGSIVLYWCGALEIINTQSIQRIKIIQ